MSTMNIDLRALTYPLFILCYVGGNPLPHIQQRPPESVRKILPNRSYLSSFIYRISLSNRALHAQLVNTMNLLTCANTMPQAVGERAYSSELSSDQHSVRGSYSEESCLRHSAQMNFVVTCEDKHLRGRR
jgi:hypothetical protein